MIVLGYGLCGNGLDGIKAGKHFLLIPRTDDCIAILLGSYQAYLCEMNKEPGTYYLSKGWLEAGTNPLEESRKYEKKYGAETANFLMDTQYRHYRRPTIVVRNQAELEIYRPRTQEVGAYCSCWGMHYEELPTLTLLAERRNSCQSLPPAAAINIHLCHSSVSLSKNARSQK